MSRRAVLAVLGIAAAVAAAAVGPETRAGATSTDTDAARVELGRRLFFDPAIGRQGKVGCASCHDPEHGFSDPRVKSVDETGELPRHSQPLTDLTGQGFHWDGEFDTVREVVEARVLPGRRSTAASVARVRRRLERAADAGPVDADAIATAAALSGRFSAYYGATAEAPRITTIAARLQTDGRYDPGFAAAFGDNEVTDARIADALVAYLATLRTTTNAYDRFLAGDEAALSPAALRGLAMFRGRAGCAQCHVAAVPGGALTDGKFHNTGVAARHAKQALSTSVDPGRAAMSFGRADRGAFKTPSLRDVSQRAPYFHDGSAKSLDDVVRYYEEGGTANDHLDARVRPFELTETERADLVEFLLSLTGAERAGLGPAWALRSPLLKIRAERPNGHAAPGVKVVVWPCGDRLAGTVRMPEPITVTTGEDGEAVVCMPFSTHFTLETFGVAPNRPLPDWTSSARVVVSPEDRVALVVQFPPALTDTPSTVTLSALGRGEEGRFFVDFKAQRTLAPGTVLFTAPASPHRRGLFSTSINAGWLRPPGPEVPIDFTPGATSAVVLWRSPAQSPPTDHDAESAIVENASAIRRLIDEMPKVRDRRMRE